MALISSLFPKKCKACRRKLKPDETTHELRVGTGDGVLSLEICEGCAKFYDMSAQVLARGRRMTDEEWDEYDDGDNSL